MPDKRSLAGARLAAKDTCSSSLLAKGLYHFLLEFDRARSVVQRQVRFTEQGRAAQLHALGLDIAGTGAQQVEARLVRRLGLRIFLRQLLRQFHRLRPSPTANRQVSVLEMAKHDHTQAEQ